MDAGERASEAIGEGPPRRCPELNLTVEQHRPPPELAAVGWGGSVRVGVLEGRGPGPVAVVGVGVYFCGGKPRPGRLCRNFF